MLVLSRRTSEKLVFPTLGVTVSVLRIGKVNVRLGIDAPRDIAVLREELAFDPKYHPAINETSFAPSLPDHSDASERIRAKIHEAAETLNRLHHLAERARWSIAERPLFQLFQQLKSIDEQIECLGGNPSGSPALQCTSFESSSVSSSGFDQVDDQTPETLTERAHQPRALLVDDNDNETRLLSSYLKIKGFEVTVATDGQRAMQSLEQHSPDVVLLDMNMPEFDGRWTIKQIRDDQRFDSLPVFAVSGTAEGDSDVEIGPRGVNHWFRKPLNPEQLVSAIHEDVLVGRA